LQCSFQGATGDMCYEQDLYSRRVGSMQDFSWNKKTGANIEAAQLKTFDPAQLYRPFAKAGDQMAAGLNEGRPLGALRAQINSELEIV